jgi:hypothetical protein
MEAISVSIASRAAYRDVTRSRAETDSEAIRRSEDARGSGHLRSDAQKKLASFRNWRLRIFLRVGHSGARTVSPPRAMSGLVAEHRDNAEAFVRRRKIDALCTDEDKVAPGTRPSPNSRG